MSELESCLGMASMFFVDLRGAHNVMDSRYFRQRTISGQSHLTSCILVLQSIVLLAIESLLWEPTRVVSLRQ